jgi:modification methylase
MANARGIIYQADARCMPEVSRQSVSLVVTSPPYYDIKDYKSDEQIGFGQSLHHYLRDLYRVWRECHRVLLPGARMCINIGDQFTRTRDFGRYKVLPLHAEVITQAEHIGFDYMGSIIWQKKTTMNTSGGASIMGSYPHPPNGIVEIDYEFILLFKKRGKRSIPREKRDKAKMTKAEWKEYFSGHWLFRGKRQGAHGAAFPRELPYRLIRMFTVNGDKVLDPFLGTGTTMQAALSCAREAIGYEINPDYISIIEEETLKAGGGLMQIYDYEVVEPPREARKILPDKNISYQPQIQEVKKGER